jgi:malic enzyme
VISNGTAVLGLGAIGPLASKPVMEGKAVLFKKFAGIDVFDIEVDELDVERSSMSWPRWSRPSAASTWKTSRRRSAS